MFKLQKLNDFKVKPLKINHPDPEEIKGGKLFPEKYFTVYLIATPMSGKTTTVFNILKTIMDKRTKFYGFVGTHNCDQSYEIMKEYFEKKKIEHEFFYEIKDKAQHYLAELIKQFKEEEKSESEDEDESTYETSIFEDENEIKIKTVKYIPKKQVPERVILFDDMSISLRDDYVNKIIKEFRHYKCCVIISSQYFKDVQPATRETLKYFLLFKGIEEKKLSDFYEQVGLNIGVNNFLNLYRDATKDKFSFLYVSKNKEFRKNFSDKYLIYDDQ